MSRTKSVAAPAGEIGANDTASSKAREQGFTTDMTAD
jgi:hypothetical protein